MGQEQLLNQNKRYLSLQVNNTATNYPKNKTIVELFEEVVRVTPEAIAIEFESQQLTYKELNEKANQLAGYLRKRGIKEETLVGVCLERSLEMIIAVLAIIKAGAGYLPLETAYPEKRLEYLIKDASAEVILTQKRLRDKIELISSDTVNVVCLDEDWEEIEKESTSNFSVLVRPENIAYVMYTSGSTGEPKGVVVSHRSVVRLVKNTNYIEINSTDIFLQFAPISFDASTLEIWGSLLNGAKLAIFPAYKPSLEELGAKVKEYQITIMWLTAALFQQMVEENLECFRGVKQLLAGGDILPVKEVKNLLIEIPKIKLINGYGPTENTTFTCCYVMTDVSQVGRTVSIGCPVSNTEIYIVDEDFNIVPIGVMGELYTSGDGLARGYLAKADLTAERFIPNPFSKNPGARLYKTGDLAKYLPDGNIDFIGRKDNQVKIRGFRIELGEIETVLDTHPVVKQSVVVVGQTRLGDKQLIAYLRIKESVVFIVNEIKEFLAKQLPEYMIPNRFIRVEKFPLTANEKVDRKALLTLSQELSEVGVYQTLIEKERISIYPEDNLLHQLFEEQALLTPTNKAVIFEDKELSYQELNNKANQLARYLQKMGVKGETLVGVCLERSLEMVVTLLAILKAGGAYIPLDPNYPKERLAFLVADSKLSVLVTSSNLTGLFTNNIDKVLLDKDLEYIEQESKNSLTNKVLAHNLAYVIYTSGSTGNPKGVLVQHNNLSNLIQTLRKAFFIESHDRVLQFASFSFDAACSEIFTSLIAGATLCLAKKESLLPPIFLLETLEKYQITNVILPPAVLRVLPEKELPMLKVIISAGEACTLDIVTQWAKNRCFLNGYGPTETTICATVARCVENTSPTIGYPIDKVEVYILDNNLQKVETVEIGEIYISGKGVSRGYLNKPSLTAEYFIPNPFSLEIGARLYKTGDLARYKPNGEIEFLGRIDTQVKLRGFRIELGEIEATLSKHPTVGNVIVISKEDSSIGKFLVAYWVSKENLAVSSEDLKAFLRQYLPEYMVPSAFLLLDSLPLTPNGKVDRQAVTLMPFYQQIQRNLTLPSGEVEEKLEKIWSEVFKLESIGTNQDFFELGGHSLLITQVLVRIKEGFNIDLPFRSFFNNPTISSLAKIIVPNSKDLSRENFLPLFLQSASRAIPLSFSQARVRFIYQLDPTNIAYNAQATLHFYGSLNIEVLEKCFNEIILRHQILRTAFPIVNQQAIQLIHPFEKVTIPVIDLQFVSKQECDIEVQKIVNKEIRHNFDITKLYLIRWTLLKLSHKEHILIHVEHHMLHDGWSFNVLLNELLVLYKAFNCGKASPLPQLPIQFSDFACYQQEWLKSKQAQKQLDYWKGRLENCPLMLQLNYDHPRPPIQTFRGGALRVEIPLGLAKELRDLSHKYNSTLFMTMLTALSILLYRYSGQQDICIGSGIANRRWDKTECLIGMIINTIVLRINLSGNPSVLELLNQVRDLTLEAYDNQDLPFDKIVERLNPERSLSYSPIYQVLFSFHDAPLPNLQFEDLEIKPQVALNNGSSKFDLNIVAIPHFEQSVGLNCETENPGITLIWEYNSDLFNKSTVEKMVEHYLSLLKAIVVKSKEPISNLQLLSKLEQEQVLVKWNQTTVQYPRNLTVYNLFELQLEKIPNSIAVVCREKTLTYQQLNEKVNELAKRLIKLGAKAETLIGICLERSLNLIIALLAVLKSGAGYVPLDPNYPNERLAFMVEDSKLSILIVENSLIEQFSNNNVEKLLLNAALDGELGKVGEIEPQNNVNLFTKTLGDNLAYVIYTSGSTGKPKGVQITHNSLTNFLYSMKQKTAISNKDILLFVTSLSFDIAALEIYLPLIVGAKLVIASSQTTVDGKALLTELKENNISIMQATPSMWHLLIAAGWKGENNPKVLCGGEAMPLALAQQLCSFSDNVWNLYGPTETTIWSTIEKVSLSENKITIGTPIDNTQVYILDSLLKPVPIGVLGYLHIAGDGLSRGYFNRPDLTAERFVPNPFSQQLGACLYNTGDVARYLPNGKIEFLGRLDSQVKIRGHRIELGEIETVVLEDPAIKEAVIIAEEDIRGNKNLVAYLVAKTDVTSQEIQEKLKAKLPNYMIPTRYVFLLALPLLPNGKIDRNSLSTTDTQDISESFVAPRNYVEEVIARIWTDILKQEKIGIYDSFFALGGHSLLALQIIFQIQKSFNVEASVRDIFESVNVASLAEKVTLSSSFNETTPIIPVARNQDLPLSFSQQRLWILAQLESDSAYNMSIALELLGSLDLIALEKSINKIVSRHEILRTSFNLDLVQEQTVQVISDSLILPLEIIDLTSLSKPEREQKALSILSQKSSEPFKLTKLPLLKSLLIRLSEELHIFFFNMHHIISDEQSVIIFLKELSNYYQEFSLGKEDSNEALPIQYADYSIWQRNKLSKEVLEKQFVYWKETLADLNPLLTFPSDLPRPAFQTYNGARYKLSLDKELSHQIISFSKKQNATLFMTMLASFKLLFYRYTGQTDIVLGSPITGRNHSDLEKLMGFFVNTLVLRTKLSAEESFIALLEKVKQTCLGAYAHQEMPFEKLVEFLQPERNASYTPIFQVMFMLQENSLDNLNLPGITVNRFDIEYKTAKFDMIVFINPLEQGLQVDIEYNTDLFKGETIERIAKNYQELFCSILANPTESINLLPTHITPSAFVFLEEPPKNSNGKIDQQSLTVDSKDGLEGFIKPQSDIERTISKIWVDILDVAKVGLNDNFFYLGGHSLIATKIISRLRKENGIELSLRDIFENPTVAELASIIEEKSKNKVGEIKKTISDRIPNVDSNKEILNKLNELSDKDVDKWLKSFSGSE